MLPYAANLSPSLVTFGKGIWARGPSHHQIARLIIFAPGRKGHQRAQAVEPWINEKYKNEWIIYA